ncbi:hypothetical protein L195_g061466, partial [Trifolium pratense]
MRKLAAIRGGKCALTQRDSVDTTFVHNDDPLLVNSVSTPPVAVSVNDNPTDDVQL